MHNLLQSNDWFINVLYTYVGKIGLKVPIMVIAGNLFYSISVSISYACGTHNSNCRDQDQRKDKDANFRFNYW